MRIIDLKTGSSKPTKDEVRRHGQLGAYQLAIEGGAFTEHGRPLRRRRPAPARQGGDHTTTLQVQVPLAVDDDPRWATTSWRSPPTGWRRGLPRDPR